MVKIDEIHDRIRAIYDGPAIDARVQLGMLLDEIANHPWTFHEAADYLGVSPRWLEEEVRAGEITPLGDGHTFWYPMLRAYKDATNARCADALAELVRLDQEMGDYDEPHPHAKEDGAR